MENDQTSGGAKLIGVIRIDFIEGVATPPEVRFLLRFPPALDPIGIEAYGASGQQLPVSAIERANPRSWGALDLLDVTIRWTGGMREISLLTTYEDVQ